MLARSLARSSSTHTKTRTTQRSHGSCATLTHEFAKCSIFLKRGKGLEDCSSHLEKAWTSQGTHWAGRKRWEGKQQREIASKGLKLNTSSWNSQGWGHTTTPGSLLRRCHLFWHLDGCLPPFLSRQEPTVLESWHSSVLGKGPTSFAPSVVRLSEGFPSSPARPLRRCLPHTFSLPFSLTLLKPSTPKVSLWKFCLLWKCLTKDG